MGLGGGGVSGYLHYVTEIMDGEHPYKKNRGGGGA